MKVCLHCQAQFLSRAIRGKFCSYDCCARFKYIKNMNDYKWRLNKLVAMAKNRAKMQSLDFDIDTDYVINLWETQNGCCFISGLKFNLGLPVGVSCNYDAPSIDKINPKLGYVKGNIRLICYQVNTSLNEYGEDRLYEMCEQILNNRTISKVRNKYVR